MNILSLTALVVVGFASCRGMGATWETMGDVTAKLRTRVLSAFGFLGLSLLLAINLMAAFFLLGLVTL